MKVLVACEFSGVVRRAFASRGHEVWSVDLLPSMDDSLLHFTGSVESFLAHRIQPDYFDLMIAHPPCTYLAVSGARWFKERRKEQDKALAFVNWLMKLPIKKKCIENPVSVISTRIRKPDQIIQPWMFGHGETKKTCLWLENLPPLTPTNTVSGRENRIHRMSPSPERGRLRSITYSGIAEAFAEQWGRDQ